MKPKIAISMGDPGGIGPEVALRAACDPAVGKVSRPVLVGDAGFLRRLARRMHLKPRIEGVGPEDEPPAKVIAVIDAVRTRARIASGKSSRAGGRVAGRAIEGAVELALRGQAAGIVTAPVSKESLAMAGYGMVGHTELISRLTGTRSCAMMILRGRLRVVFATTHLKIGDVAGHLTRRGIVEKIDLAQRYLPLYLGVENPRIGVTCLNPHCGEGGRLGREEDRVIRPAVRQAARKGICVEGPYPADSIYKPTFVTRFDAIVAMYHDQGMIPLRLKGHDDVVNITLGIPCVRTSPGHGTAFDIAGRFTASAASMVKAVLMCARIAKRLENAC